MPCLFAVDSLVDFLAFAFALNTMFSFTRVRRRLLLKIQKEIQQSLDDLRPLVEDCQKSIGEACTKENKSKVERALNLNSVFSKAEKKKKEYQGNLEYVSNAFQGAFVFTAVITAFALVFSQTPFLVAHYEWTLALLIPPIAFFCDWLWFRFRIESSAREINQEAEQFKVRISGVRVLMEEILSPKNNPDSIHSLVPQSGEVESSGGRNVE